MNLFADLPEREKRILEHFDSVIRDVQPLNAKQLLHLPHDIRDLSALLTAERSQRKTGYMNNAAVLSAYTHYFMWWNLFRLTSLFAGMEKDAFDFLHGDAVCLDIGSGPLTLPLALYLARPELRAKKLTWYCMDISQSALTLGENLFLTCAAQLQTGAETAWRIVRVKGGIGTRIKQRVCFVCCANMFNELYWDTPNPLEKEAKKYADLLLSYTAQNTSVPHEQSSPHNGAEAGSAAGTDCAVFVAEPGIPRASRFVSLLRSALIRRKMKAVSPCPHENVCPMDGKRGGKWCHFILDTKNAPERLKALSEKAKLPKDRAALSFVFARSTYRSVQGGIRICSDPIYLPEGKTGRYACASWGLTLVRQRQNGGLTSGALLFTDLNAAAIRQLPHDRKSGAKILDEGRTFVACPIA